MIEERIADLELAVLGLAALEFGDLPGHDFHGNQYKDGSGGPGPRSMLPDKALRDIEARRGRQWIPPGTHNDRSGGKRFNKASQAGPRSALSPKAKAAIRERKSKPFDSDRWKANVIHAAESNVEKNLMHIHEGNSHRVPLDKLSKFIDAGYVERVRVGGKYGDSKYVLTNAGHERVREARDVMGRVNSRLGDTSGRTRTKV